MPTLKMKLTIEWSESYEEQDLIDTLEEKGGEIEGEPDLEEGLDLYISNRESEIEDDPVEALANAPEFTKVSVDIT